jgi:hypothetical protein
MVDAVRVKGGIQIQFSDGRVGFVQLKDAEALANKLLQLAKPQK